MTFVRPSTLLLLLLPLVACSGTGIDPPPPGGDLACAVQRCDAPACSATTGTKTFGLADLDAEKAKSWVIVSWVASDLFENELVNVDYSRASPSALTAKRTARTKRSIEERRRRAFGPAHHDLLFGPERKGRLEAEKKIRRAEKDAVPAKSFVRSGIIGRTAELLPPGVLKQGMDCATAAPFCTGDAICVTGAGGDRTCESALQIKWRDQDNITSFEMVNATVRKVGTHAAIVTDDADTVAQADIDLLLSRFDERIAPIDHQFFGEPVNASGEDFDNNGVAILFLTSKVATIDANLAGFFQAIDLEDPTVNNASNGADMLYMQPPGGGVSLHSLSGTLAHEYEHLISYYAKVINRSSSQESAWLDEGLATFAEDITGYGSDAFKNIAAYLAAVSDTSLTGFGLLHSNESDADSLERRGMAHLFLRFIFEQRGGATYGSGAAAVTDDGGIMAINKLVQSADTSVEVLSAANTGRSLDAWLADFMTAVAVDGADYPAVNCTKDINFADPENDAFTDYQRGVDLRTSFPDADGTPIPFNGPSTASFEAEEVPVPSNGGEVRTLTISGETTIGIGGPAEDYVIGFHAIPIAAN